MRLKQQLVSNDGRQFRTGLWTLLLLLTVSGLVLSAPLDEDGYDLWLRYRPIENETIVQPYRDDIRGIYAPGDSQVLVAAVEELQRGLEGLLDRPAPVWDEPRAGALILGTPASNPVVKDLGLGQVLESLGEEGFLIRSVQVDGQEAIVIAANADIGVLYGAFRFLRELQMHRPIADMSIQDTPHLRYRVLNHWDSVNGVVSRGYAGQSLWQWDELPETVSPRYKDYGRACASVGINMTVLNGSYSGLTMLESEYLEKIAALADALRPYGVRVAIHPNFAAPLMFEATETADPADPAVQKWWQDKADEICEMIPDFGGFMVKADSEGCPGPHDYNATHADGANLLADALKPHGGIVMWRAFGVFDSNVEGYPGEKTPGLGLAARPTDLFTRIDGKFQDNVFVQAKNGPRDFQPREPLHPLLGGLEETPVMMEVQITQEYFGHDKHLVYLAPVWKEALEFDTHARGEGSTVQDALDGTLFGNEKMTGMAGVANTGTDRNWTGHLFAQANWYAYGRLAWAPSLSSRDIAEEWIRLTFGNEQRLVEVISNMMLGSREAAVNYMTPLGLFQLNDNRTMDGQRSHYAPQPSRRRGHHAADREGIGGSWIVKGIDKQYHDPVTDVLSDPDRCPEKYLLWFHHVSWDRKMSTGRTLWEEMCYRYVSGVEYVKDMRKQWQSLKGMIDEERWKHVDKKLRVQIKDAETWRNECLIYFSAVSGRKIPPGILRQCLEERE